MLSRATLWLARTGHGSVHWPRAGVCAVQVVPRRHIPYASALCQELDAPLLPSSLLHILEPAVIQVLMPPLLRLGGRPWPPPRAWSRQVETAGRRQASTAEMHAESAALPGRASSTARTQSLPRCTVRHAEPLGWSAASAALPRDKRRRRVIAICVALTGNMRHRPAGGLAGILRFKRLRGSGMITALAPCLHHLTLVAPGEIGSTRPCAQLEPVNLVPVIVTSFTAAGTFSRAEVERTGEVPALSLSAHAVGHFMSVGEAGRTLLTRIRLPEIAHTKGAPLAHTGSTDSPRCAQVLRTCGTPVVLQLDVRARAPSSDTPSTTHSVLASSVQCTPRSGGQSPTALLRPHRTTNTAMSARRRTCTASRQAGHVYGANLPSPPKTSWLSVQAGPRMPA